MQEHSSTPKLPLVDGYQGKGKQRCRKTKADAATTQLREIETQKVLRALAGSAIPLTAQQIKAVSGKISNLKTLIAYLKHKRCLEVAFRAKSPNGPYLEDFYRLVRPMQSEGGKACQPL